MKNPDNYEMLYIPCKVGEVSDGYHTFNDLDEFRKLYNALLFNEWAVQHKYDVHKSKKHYDGELCFGGGWFIVVAVLPTGQITNHYKMEDWDLFQIPEFPKARYEYDGHTPQDTLLRMRSLCENMRVQEVLWPLNRPHIHLDKENEEVVQALEVVSNWIKQIQRP